MYKDIDVLIVTYKSSKIIDKCLEKIDNKFQIVIAENSSDSDFKKKIEKKYTNVNCVLTGKNHGFGKAFNIGMQYCKKKYVFHLNPDSFLFHDTIAKLYSAAEKIKDFAMIAPEVKNLQLKNYGFFDQEENITKQNQKLFRVDYIKGPAMFIQKKEFEEVSFFDENIFLYLEEIDLCKRLLMKNKKMYIIPEAQIEHLGGKSHDSEFSHEIEYARNWHYMWSLFYFNKKHYGILTAYRKTIKKFISSFLKMIFYFFLRKNKKYQIYKCRFLGLLNSYLNKKSSYRNKIN